MSVSRNSQALAVGFMAVFVFLTLLGGRAFRRAPRTESESTVSAESSSLPRPVFIPPQKLAEFLLRRRTDLTLVDLREPEQYSRYHLPGAINLSPAELVGPAGKEILGSASDHEIILYADDMLDPFDAAAELIRKRYTHVHVLEGGLDRFRKELLTPPSLRAVVSETRARAEAGLFQTYRQFFLQGGHQVRGIARDPEALTAPTVVSTAWLERNLSRVIPVDVRGQEEYEAGHVPGAVHLDAKELRTEKDGISKIVREANALAEMVGSRGIGPENEIVVYGKLLENATLAAVAFLRVGHQKLAVLEGGWPHWQAEERKVSTSSMARSPQVYPIVEGTDDFTVSTDEVYAASQAKTALIIDTRTPEEFRGETNAVNGRAGHVPGAVLLEVSKNLAPTPEGNYWRAPVELTSAYDGVGAEPASEVIVYCQSGRRASVSYYTLKYLLGFPHVRWYDGSWKAWGASDYPVESDGGES